MASMLRLRSGRLFVRRYASDYFAEQQAIEKHAGETATTWKWVSLLAGIPTCGFLFYKHVIMGEEEHHAEWTPYEHVRIRKVPFPWGDESLFHSKHNVGPNQTHDEDGNIASKENFITAFLRRKQEEVAKRSWKMMMEHCEEHHQQMMEHIERKKFIHIPPLPKYGRLFGRPPVDLQNPKTRLPVGFDD